MKKYIFITLLFLGIFFISKDVFACSPVAGAVYPSPETVLSDNSTAIGIYKITSDGQNSNGILLVGNENSIMNMVFKLDLSSCSTRLNDFKKGEYIVSIFNKNDSEIIETDLDSQFSYSFLDQKDAVNKYTALYNIWNDRKIYLGEVLDSGDISYIVAGKTLKLGMKDNYVLALQIALKNKLNLGDEFKLDSYYGPATVIAVKQFQKENGLENDGVAGVLTQTKLSGTVIGKEDLTQKTTAYILAGKTLKLGMKNDNAVLKLQQALKLKLGLDEGFLLDSSYGPATFNAVKQFQIMEFLDDDGVAGLLTQEKLVGTLIPIINKDEVVNNSEQTIQEEVVVENKEENNSDINEDIIDNKLKSILSQAKNQIINYTKDGSKNYINAYKLIVGYNNQFLSIYSDSDPLYKSSGGGKYFVYSILLKNGEYICADNNLTKEVTQKIMRPDMTKEHVSC